MDLEKLLLEAKGNVNALYRELDRYQQNIDFLKSLTGEAVKMKIDVWYDRYTRSWVVQLKDVSGNQIGTADYVYTKREAELIADRLKKEHNIE